MNFATYMSNDVLIDFSSQNVKIKYDVLEILMFSDFEFAYFQRRCHDANLSLERLCLESNTIRTNNVNVDIATNVIENELSRKCHLALCVWIFSIDIVDFYLFEDVDEEEYDDETIVRERLFVNERLMIWEKLFAYEKLRLDARALDRIDDDNNVCFNRRRRCFDKVYERLSRIIVSERVRQTFAFDLISLFQMSMKKIVEIETTTTTTTLIDWKRRECRECNYVRREFVLKFFLKIIVI